MYEKYKDDGFMLITLLGEDMSGRTPNKADLQDWADTFGLEHPVVADANFSVTSRYVNGFSISLPSMDLLAPGAEIQVKNNLP